MPFPLSYSTTFIMNKDRYHIKMSAVVRSILMCLQKEEASEVCNDKNVILFKGGIRFVNSFNILLPITSGSITINEIDREMHVDCKIQFTQLLILSITVILIFFIPIFLFKTNFNFIRIFCTIIFIWLWLFGLNYLTTIFRFPRFLKKCIIKSQQCSEK